MPVDSLLLPALHYLTFFSSLFSLCPKNSYLISQLLLYYSASRSTASVPQEPIYVNYLTERHTSLAAGIVALYPRPKEYKSPAPTPAPEGRKTRSQSKQRYLGYPYDWTRARSYLDDDLKRFLTEAAPQELSGTYKEWYRLYCEHNVSSKDILNATRESEAKNPPRHNRSSRSLPGEFLDSLLDENTQQPRTSDVSRSPSPTSRNVTRDQSQALF